MAQNKTIQTVEDALSLAAVFVPQVQVGLTVVNLIGQAIAHFQQTQSTELPEELKQQFQESLARRQDAETDWAEFLKG